MSVGEKSLTSAAAVYHGWWRDVSSFPTRERKMAWFAAPERRTSKGSPRRVGKEGDREMAHTEVRSTKLHPGDASRLDELSWTSGRSVSELLRLAVQRFLSDLGVAGISDHEENDDD